MESVLNRRSFLKRTSLAAGALSAGGLLRFPNILANDGKTKTLNCVQIGCGGRAKTHLDWIVGIAKAHLSAIVDPDERRHAEVKRWLADRGQDTSKLQVFTDYRVMFDRIGKEVDAVFIATPNHHHAPAAMRAMQLDKAVYCEKPLCHDIGEARKLREMARVSKSPTQMGNQGHCGEGYRRLCELVWAGNVGHITETHSWTDRANGGVGPRPPNIPVPSGLHWDEWVGPAKFREFHDDLHPHEWHGWHDFGNGSIGNMGCHILDGVFWALKLEHPARIEVQEMRDGSNERYPTGSRIRWDFPSCGEMPAVKVYWYEGLNQSASGKASGSLRTAVGEMRNLPPLLVELQKQYPDEDFDSGGTLYVGEKGILYTATYGDRIRLVPTDKKGILNDPPYGGKKRLLPIEKMPEISPPPRTLPRCKNIFENFLDACRAGEKETAASFDYGARLTEFTLLGNIAQHAGVGKIVEWDGAAMKVTNLPELNQWVSRPYRQGWST